jgi:futalosine hydrolase
VRILVVAATAAEIGPLMAELRPSTRSRSLRAGESQRITSYPFDDHHVDVLVSGVGMVATATWCTYALARERYDLALNFGVCGAFDRTLSPGSVVHVVSDRFSELGAEDGDGFLTIQQLQLLGDDEPPFTGGRLVNHAPPASATLNALRAVDGITVNTVHGREQSIACVIERFAPQVESMEGAAFVYACLVHGQPFAQIRAVSNVVEPRNRAAWRLIEAIEDLNATALRLLAER